MIGTATFGCGCAVCNGTKRLEPATLRAAEILAIDPNDDGDGNVAVGGSYEGAVNFETDTDNVSVTLEAGKTYLFSLRGHGAEPLLDPFIQLLDPAGVPLGTDDDGGTGINSMLTFTAVVPGTYKIVAGALAATGGVGQYIVDVREMGADGPGATHATATPLTVGGNVFGFIEASGDVDLYRIEMVAGRLYSFEIGGGADYNTNYLAVPPGELDTKLTLYDADGNEVAFNDDISGSAVQGDISSRLAFLAEASGTYYLRVEAYSGDTGGYALVSDSIVLADQDPLASIDWGSKLASKDVKVYFAKEGESFDGVASLGWTPYEIAQAMKAFQVWADVTDLVFSIVDTAAAATFKLVTTVSDGYLGYFNPPGTENEGVGVFAINGTGWERIKTDGGLEPGGYGWITLIHEFGHGIGLAHPHDNGGGSDVMAGVTGPFDSLGVYDLNQGVWTTMSYNDGWRTHPDNEDGTPPGNPVAWGWQAGPGAFDIAAVQAKYGADSGRNAGDTVYTLPTANATGTFWTTIWDVGGTDTIAHEGTIAATIDLLAATLDYSPTGAGVISFAEGVFGGFTIAAGVVVENARGGSGADILAGNAAANLLDGRGGADTMIGRGGDDIYVVDTAADTIVEQYDEGLDEVRTGIGVYTLAQSVERLRATNDNAHDWRGNNSPNIFVGGGGNDVMRLQDGGDDVAFGNGGVDSFYFGAAFTAFDRVDGGDNRDSLILQGDYSAGVVLGDGVRSSIVNVESISLMPGSITSYGDISGVFYSYDLTMIDGNVAAGALMKVNGFHLRAGENFALDASAETDAPLQIFAGLGRDTLIGGAQGDSFVFGQDGRFSAGDTVVGGGGYDILYLRGDYAIDFNAAGFAGSFSGVESIALLTSANTEFVGGGDGDFDYSITWNDAMLAAGAVFTINGSRLQAHESFAFDGSRESDGQLRVFGGAASDTLATGAGNDQLYGGGGADLLTGGGGADLYRYLSAADSGPGAYDTIHGFAPGADRIDLQRIDARSSSAEDDAFAFIGNAAFTAAGQLRAVNVSGNLWRVEGEIDGDGVADFVLEAHVDSLQPLAAGDFLL
ncbi:MAG TPA: M10 family metallopeptidase C-terminal domain-containing protein [Allosphingosinicella sp.]|jgi:hypothetical protein